MSGDLPEFKWWDDGGAMLDQIICSCGWESRTFYDGREFAYAQWRRHVGEDHTKPDSITQALPEAQKTL